MAAASIAAITMPASTGGSTPVAVIVNIPSVTPGKSSFAATPMVEQSRPTMITSIPPITHPFCAVFASFADCILEYASYDTDIESRNGSTRYTNFVPMPRGMNGVVYISAIFPPA